MNLPLTARINDDGRLEIGGCDAVLLARKYGTPLYVVDEEDIRARCRLYIKTFRALYENIGFIFASKALSVVGVQKVINEEGFGADVVSGGEIYTALKAKVDPKNICLHGNNKSVKEMEEALRISVGRIVIDNFDEINKLDEVSRKLKKRADVLIRVNPGVEAHTHDAVKTGQTDSKFGIAKQDIVDAVKAVTSAKNLCFIGLHAHIGSQIFDADGYLAEIDVLTQLANDIKTKLKEDVLELNIGGGIGVAYVEGDDPLDLEGFAKAITDRLKERLVYFNLPKVRLVLEPGRSIVARGGITLYTVGHLKEVKGIRKYVIVDGGMSDNIRPMLYGAKYEFLLANDMNAQRMEKMTIAGRFCESGDVLAKDVMMPAVKSGDILAVLCTGAYNYSMASNYNRVPRPAMVMAANGKDRLILKRETYKGITSCDV